jgi:hypothetical protein
MMRVWDGFLSGLCALITLVLVGTPLWAAVGAVRAALVPQWVWVPIVLLGFVGIVMMAAFGRKAVRGVHPLRERRR